MKERDEFLKTVLLKSRDFYDVPMISPFSDGKWYFTARKLEWSAENEHKGKYTDTTVPKGFITDLTSVPRPFWSLLPRDGIYLPAAIVHDYNYWFQDISREESDDIFNVGMAELNVPKTQRLIIYNAVKLAGGFSWKANAKMKSAGENRVLTHLPDTLVTLEDWRERVDK